MPIPGYGADDSRPGFPLHLRGHVCKASGPLPPWVPPGQPHSNRQEGRRARSEEESVWPPLCFGLACVPNQGPCSQQTARRNGYPTAQRRTQLCCQPHVSAQCLLVPLCAHLAKQRLYQQTQNNPVRGAVYFLLAP